VVRSTNAGAATVDLTLAPGHGLPALRDLPGFQHPVDARPTHAKGLGDLLAHHDAVPPRAARRASVMSRAIAI
jgi:hypothetical protein